MEFGIKDIKQVESLRDVCQGHMSNLENFFGENFINKSKKLAESTGAPEFTKIAEKMEAFNEHRVSALTDALKQVSLYCEDAIEEVKKHERDAENLFN